MFTNVAAYVMMFSDFNRLQCLASIRRFTLFTGLPKTGGKNG